MSPRGRREVMTVLLAVCLAGGCGGQEGAGDERAADRPELPPEMPDMTPTVVLETSKGRIVMELDRESAPKTVENLVSHVEAGFYDGLIFHRVIPGFMIQAGGFTPDMTRMGTPADPVPNEADNGLKNERGTVAMARTNDPHSATTQFFINLADNPRLDFQSKSRDGWGYTVFGRVVDGMEVVDSIAAVSTTTKGQHGDVPVEPIVIERAYVSEAE